MLYADSVVPDQPLHPRRRVSESYTVSLSLKLDDIDLSPDSVTLRSDCVEAQADLELQCPHMTFYPRYKDMRELL